jgi:hypothetical protein
MVFLAAQMNADFLFFICENRRNLEAGFFDIFSLYPQIAQMNADF